MKHKSMAEMNRERALRKAKEEADKDDENPNTYYKFLDLFYKNKKEKDDKEQTDCGVKRNYQMV